MAEKKPVILKSFSGGWVTEIISDSLDINMSPDLENVDFSASGSVKKTWGYEELYSDSENAINNRLIVVPDRQGVEFLFKKCGTKIKLLDETIGRWDTILAGLTDNDVPVYEYFDGTVYIISDIDEARSLDLIKNTRLTADVLLGAATVDVVSTAQFGATGTFYLNGAIVTYTGKTATSFTGCTGVLASENNSRAFITMTNVGGANQIPKGTITAQFAGRLFVGKDSVLYGSKLNDLTNFAVAGSGTGDAIQKTIESKVNALKVFYDDQNNLRLLSFAANNKIYIHDVLDEASLSSTIMTLSMFKDNVTAINQLSTLVGPNNLYHVDARNQVRSLGQTYATKGVNKVYSDSMSKFHENLFKLDYHFDDARAVIYGNEYWMICREGNGAVNNRLVIFDFEAGNWRQRTGINANDIAIYNGNVVLADATRNMVFKFQESLMSDNDESIYFKYSTPDLDLDKLRYERLRRVRVAGFISKNCLSTVKLYSDFASNLLGEFTINGNDTNITGKLLGKDATFGGMVFGDQVIGGESGGMGIRFFLADLQMTDCPDLENFRVVFENNQANVYFEVTAIKPFIEQKNEDYWPVNKIKNIN
jgi:hypothetical protein